MEYRNLLASCDRRVNRGEGEEGEGSHPARRATRQWRCQLTCGAVGCQPRGQIRCQLKSA